MILDEKVENVIDKDHVIDALKNGIHLNDYIKKAENYFSLFINSIIYTEFEKNLDYKVTL